MLNHHWEKFEFYKKAKISNLAQLRTYIQSLIKGYNLARDQMARRKTIESILTHLHSGKKEN